MNRDKEAYPSTQEPTDVICADSCLFLVVLCVFLVRLNPLVVVVGLSSYLVYVFLVSVGPFLLVSFTDIFQVKARGPLTFQAPGPAPGRSAHDSWIILFHSKIYFKI